MLKFCIVFIFIIALKPAAAQHIGYRNKPKPPSKVTIKNQRDSVKVVAKDSVAKIITPHNECPGMRGPLPVLMNYVPPEIVMKLKKEFNGDMYSITSLKISATELEYKLKVCYNGAFVIRFANTEGLIVR